MKTIDLKIERSGDDSPKEYKPPQYPSFTIESSEDHGIPDEGTAVIKFSKRDSSHNEDEDGKHTYRCTVEVQEMSKIKGGKGKAKDDEEGSADEEAGETEEEEAAEQEEETPKKGKGKRPAAVSAVLGRGQY